MERRTGSTLPLRVTQLRGRIERWRRQRGKRSPMPEELWSCAVSFARRHGVYPVARALRIDYGALKKRTTERPQNGARICEFVEVAASPLVGGVEASGKVVELWGTDGTKLVLRLPAGEGLDVGRLAEVFWRRCR